MIRLIGFERTVTDLARSERFYVDHLGFAARERAEGALALERGGQRLTLRRAEAVVAPLSGCDPTFQHLALPVRDIEAAVAALPAAVAAFTRGGPQRLPARSGGVSAFKFRDPDGLPLELIAFPDGRMDGIDHSALVVADAARSIRFYEGLGLRVGARQTNTGPEQDRLDGLDGVVVDVIALEAEGGTPHVELLAYRQPPVAPGTGRSATTLVFAVAGDDATLADPDGHPVRLIRA